MTTNETSADVLVVGAGPAGSAAAFFLAQAGVDVLLADRARFPRDKVCGDGVSSVALPVLHRMGLGDWVRAGRFLEPREMLLAAPNGQYVVKHIPPRAPGEASYGYTVPRRVLDAALFQQAVAAGARPLEKTRVLRRIGHGDGRSLLAVQRNGQEITLSARLVVAADGVSGGFTRSLDLVRRRPEMVACRAYYEDVGGDPDRLDIYYDKSVMPGYAWIFPMANGRANVGLGAYFRQVKQNRINLAAALERFVADHPLARERLASARRTTPIQGYPLRARQDSTVAMSHGVLVAGEAAGLVSPLTGEGIGPALESGELAAQHALRALEAGDVSTANLASYAHEVRRRWAGEHRAARVVRALLQYPALVNRAVRQMQRDSAFALQVGYVIIGFHSPEDLLNLRTVIRLLFPL